MRPGTRIKVKEGWGFHVYDPIEFRQSDGVTGTVERKTHKNPNTLYFRLDSGELASTAISGIERI